MMIDDVITNILDLTRAYDNLADASEKVSSAERFDLEDTMTKVLGLIDDLIEKGHDEL